MFHCKECHGEIGHAPYCKQPKKPHKHAEIIKAWADGAVIQQRYTDRNLNYKNWEVVKNPIWNELGCEYRIKPEPKPDVIRYGFADIFGSRAFLTPHQFSCDNVKYTFDGENPDILKSVEIIK